MFLLFFGQQVHICFFITGLVRYFKTATEINHFQFGKMRDDIKQYFNSFYKHIRIFYIAAGMNMQGADK